MSEKKNGTTCLTALRNLSLVCSLTLVALRADGTVSWAWYWLLAPVALFLVLTLFAGLVAAVAEEMKSG